VRWWGGGMGEGVRVLNAKIKPFQGFSRRKRPDFTSSWFMKRA